MTKLGSDNFIRRNAMSHTYTQNEALAKVYLTWHDTHTHTPKNGKWTNGR